MAIEPVVMPRITSGWEREVWKKKLARIINKHLLFYDQNEIIKRPETLYDNKSPFSIARPGLKK